MVLVMYIMSYDHSGAKEKPELYARVVITLLRMILSTVEYF